MKQNDLAFFDSREQRLTRTLAFVMIGISILLTPVLCHVPLPVLYGVFLYMGVNVLKGIQFTDRLLLFFMPNKYQPDHAYLRRMPISRVHLFTGIQLGFLILLWIVKNTKETSFVFPIMVRTVAATKTNPKTPTICSKKVLTKTLFSGCLLFAKRICPSNAKFIFAIFAIVIKFNHRQLFENKED